MKPHPAFHWQGGEEMMTEHSFLSELFFILLVQQNQLSLSIAHTEKLSCSAESTDPKVGPIFPKHIVLFKVFVLHGLRGLWLGPGTSELERSWSHTSEGQDCNRARSFHNVAPVTTSSWHLACYAECDMGDPIWAVEFAAFQRLSAGHLAWDAQRESGAERASARPSGITWQCAMGTEGIVLWSVIIIISFI